MSTPVRLICKISLCLMALIHCPERYGYCDTFTWTGGSPILPFIANNWSNPSNWQGGLIPSDDGTADVIMPNTPRDNPVVDMPWSINSITFTGSGNYSLNGDPLTLNAITHNGTGTATFNNSVGVSLGFAGAEPVWNAANGPIVVNGSIFGSSNPLTIVATEGVRFDGVVANTLDAAVIVIDGTLLLSKSSAGGAIRRDLIVDAAIVSWDAPDQIDDVCTLNLFNGALASLGGNDEGFAELTLIGNSLLTSTGGDLFVVNQTSLQDSSAIDMGSGELTLDTVSRSGNSASTSRINAGLVKLTTASSTFGVENSTAAVELEVNAPISGSVGTILSKSGTGALRLTGASTYQGGTSVTTGTLIVDNSTGSGTGTGSVTLQPGTRLTGDGAVGGAVTMGIGSSISPANFTGFSIGNLGVGSLAMNNTSVFEVQFSPALPPAIQRDVLTVAGNASINGNLVLQNLSTSEVPDEQTTYTILFSAALSGSFDNVANGQRLNTSDGSGSFVVNYGPGNQFPSRVILSDFQPSVLLGDCNGDGAVNLLDVEAFLNTLIEGQFLPEADINQDGVVNLLDVEPFVELLSGG